MEATNEVQEVNETDDVKEFTSNDMIGAIVITAMGTFAILIIIINGAML